jgi:hypothetical protein
VPDEEGLVLAERFDQTERVAPERVGVVGPVRRDLGGRVAGVNGVTARYPAAASAGRTASQV